MEHTETSKVHVTMYTKVGCHLCEEARELLDEIAGILEQQELQSFELTEIDIRNDMSTYESYRYRIPVVLINGTVIAEGRIEYEDLAPAFQL
jgi:glutaredoxin